MAHMISCLELLLESPVKGAPDFLSKSLQQEGHRLGFRFRLGGHTGILKSGDYLGFMGLE